jgi:FAD synthase
MKFRVEKGNGIAKQLGFPTMNVFVESEDCGVFIVDEVDYGLGVSFVMPNLTEIHFFDDVSDQKEEIDYEVLYKIDPPEGGILDYFYKGLYYAEMDSSGDS